MLLIFVAMLIFAGFLIAGAYHAGKMEGRSEAKKELAAEKTDPTDIYVDLMQVFHEEIDLQPLKAMSAKIAADALMDFLQMKRTDPLQIPKGIDD